MIEMILLAVECSQRLEQEAFKRKLEADQKWHQDFLKADPEMRNVMLEVREKQRREEVEERRHRENIQAQNRIADAIRSSSQHRSYFF